MVIPIIVTKTHPQPVLILASGSPRRAELLQSAGFEPVVRPPGCDETRLADESPADYVQRIALAKCEAGVRELGAQNDGKDCVVLAADTIVVAPGGQVFGKPDNVAEAGAMLACLMEATHTVLTAFAVAFGDGRHSEVCATEVTMGPISVAAAAAYWDCGEPRDKAGGYAIQGRGGMFVTAINGSYSNVVGLPVAQCAEVLARFGVRPAWQQKVTRDG